MAEYSDDDDDVLQLRKNLNQENRPDRGSNPGLLGERQRCYPLTSAVVTPDEIEREMTKGKTRTRLGNILKLENKHGHRYIQQKHGRTAVTDLEIFDRGGPIEYHMEIYQNSGHTKIVAN